jgi:SAM-dependent methyltransferase
MTDIREDAVRNAVRENYAAVAKRNPVGWCGGPIPDGDHAFGNSDQISSRLGYSDDELAAVPEGSNMGLGCGNPTAIAALTQGQTVVDLGSGGGLDCFLAAKQVGPEGRVIGVDMTPEMIAKARENARKVGAENVEFRLGEIEHLPVADGSVDVILSNCVVNLSPDKPQVYRDAFRTLKPGGRLAISDVVALEPLADSVMQDLVAIAGCIGGAAQVDEIESWLTETGFVDVKVTINPASAAFIEDWLPGSGLENKIASATVEAVKP